MVPTKALILPTVSVALAIFILLLLPGCNRKPKPTPVTVRVLRDLNSPYAHELDHRILEFQSTNPHATSGAPITVATYQEQPYETAIKDHLDKDMTTEVVILNSAQDANSNVAAQADLRRAVNICAAVRACPAVVPAFVPSSLTGDQAEAGMQFIAFLQKPPR